MPIKVLLKLDNLDVTAHVTSYKVGRNKIWGTDTGRVLSGKWVGSLVGIFPKIDIDFYAEDGNDLQNILTKLDQASLTIHYHSPKHGMLKSLGTYSSDYEVKYRWAGDDGYVYDTIRVAFISEEREK